MSTASAIPAGVMPNCCFSVVISTPFLSLNDFSNDFSIVSKRLVREQPGTKTSA